MVMKRLRHWLSPLHTYLCRLKNKIASYFIKREDVNPYKPVKSNFKLFKEKLSEKYQNNRAYASYFVQFVFVVFFYGFVVSFILNYLLGTEVSLKSIIAMGFVSYLVKAEMPDIISSCFPKKPPQPPNQSS